MSKTTLHTLNIDNQELSCYDLSEIKILSINGNSYTLTPTAPNEGITTLDLSEVCNNRADKDTLDILTKYSAIPSAYNALSPNTCNGLSYLSPRSPNKLSYIANYCAKEEKRDYLEKMMERNRREANRREAHIFVPKIEAIFANEEKGTLVIKWKTGEETKVQTQKGDQFDVWVGVQAAITKYVLGNNYNAGTVLEKYVDSVKLTSKKEK